MEKQSVLSFYDVVTFTLNNSAKFSELQELIENCRNIHSLSFDYNTAKAFNSESKEKLESMESEIDLQIKKVMEIIKACFDFNSENLAFTQKSVFNEVVVPLSEVQDK